MWNRFWQICPRDINVDLLSLNNAMTRHDKPVSYLQLPRIWNQTYQLFSAPTFMPSIKVGKSLRGWGILEKHYAENLQCPVQCPMQKNLLTNEGIKRESKMSTLEIWNLKSEMHLSLKQRGRKQLMTCLNLSPAFWPSEPTIVQSNAKHQCMCQVTNDPHR